MLKPAVFFYVNSDALENDVRSLLMAFYPGSQVARTEEIPPEPGAAEVSAAAVIGTGVMELQVSDERHAVLRERASFPADADRKTVRTVCKQVLYRLLCAQTGRTLPWGTLTGIRPTKIARMMLSDGQPEEAAVRYREDEMLCSPQKTALSLEIAKRELALLRRLDYDDGYSIYLGIPFCPTTCAYCSFTSYPISRYAGRVDEYLDCLEKELDFTAEAFRDKKLNTIYFGGGTPTTLAPEQSARLLKMVTDRFSLDHLKEWTVEAGRPDSITREKLRVLAGFPVTRISINPQTMKQETLARIGRRHTVEQVSEAFHLAREEGFDNINMDIIVGLPDETAVDVEDTLKKISALGPDSLTVHSLAIKRTARLNLNPEEFEGTVSYNSEAVMDMTASAAAGMGLFPYYLYRQKNMTGNLENVGYAAPGKEGLYNILIMEEVQPIVALGAGAVTKGVWGSRIERCENVKDIDSYLSRIDEMIERKRKLFRTV